jgi:hypothetical protein
VPVWSGHSPTMPSLPHKCPQTQLSRGARSLHRSHWMASRASQPERDQWLRTLLCGAQDGLYPLYVLFPAPGDGLLCLAMPHNAWEVSYRLGWKCRV